MEHRKSNRYKGQKEQKEQMKRGGYIMKNFLKDESGLSTLEYIIGAGVMAGLALLVFNVTLKDSITGASKDVGNAIDTAGNQASMGK